MTGLILASLRRRKARTLLTATGIAVEAAVLSTIGIWSSLAARATASSASGCTIDITPTGASITGAGM